MARLTELEGRSLTRKAERRRRSIEALTPGLSVALMSCGSGQTPSSNQGADGGSQELGLQTFGDVTSSAAPVARASRTESLFEAEAADPYWVKSLEMEYFEYTTQRFSGEDNIFYYTFPEIMPTYFDKAADERGWQPVTQQVQTATVDILNKVGQVIDIDFQYTDNPRQPFVIALMSNAQGNTDAYAYFPDVEFSIGSDIFISPELLNPKKISANKTNYDYEVIVHELGHALGLKHSFAPLGENDYFLPPIEDRSNLTAMTYSEDAHFFNGEFRPYDYLTLVQFYGINPTLNSGDDTYFFSTLGGTYIIDAGGRDTIDASEGSGNAFVDLRENSHSHLEVEHQFISAPFQMTISMHSQIEDVLTGSGDDHVIGNNLDNYITTSAGNDVVFAGGGRDTIDLGVGANKVNLYESEEANDFVVFGPHLDECFNSILNFQVGGKCDVIVLSKNAVSALTISPVIAFSPSLDLAQYDIYRIKNFDAESALSGSSISARESKIIISEAVGVNGEDTQLHYYQASDMGQGEVHLIAEIDTNGASLALWSADNFLLA
jgi:serralysin